MPKDIDVTNFQRLIEDSNAAKESLKAKLVDELRQAPTVVELFGDRVELLAGQLVSQAEANIAGQMMQEITEQAQQEGDAPPQ